MAYVSIPSNRTPKLISQIADTFAALAAGWRRSRTYARTYNELSALSNRDLADIGISRSMVSRMAYEAAYGRDD